MPIRRRTFERLATARRNGTLIKLHRASRPDQSVNGFVIDFGRKWALVALIEDGYFDGYATVRISDVAKVQRSLSFQETFARTQPEWPPQAPRDRPTLNLDSTAGMLATFLQPGVLLGIERDRKYDGRWVGVPNELTKRWFYLWEVSYRGEWYPEPLGYRPRTITMVITGGRYLEALASTASAPPSEDLPHHWTARSKASRKQLALPQSGG